MRNPYDNSDKFDFDLPGDSGGENEEYERLVRESQRGEALKQKSLGSALTESRAFAILAEYVEGQRQARINQLLLTPITDGNKDELNYMRGEVAGLMLALRFAKAIVEGAEATLEVFKEARKSDEVVDASGLERKH